MKHLKTIPAFFFLFVAAACGGGDPSGTAPVPTDDPPTEDSVPDTTPPVVVGISPADGSIGVYADTDVVIEFSEPMDELSVQSSLDTEDLDAVTFEWSDDKTMLTIIPNELLLYAQGGNLENTEALKYVVTVGTGAHDRAGNALASASQTEFHTLREIPKGVFPIDALTASVNPGDLVAYGEEDLYVGDDGAGGLAKSVRGLVTWDLSEIPDEAVGISSAMFHGIAPEVSEFSFQKLGSILVEHGTFEIETDDFATATGLEINHAFHMTSLDDEAGVLMTYDSFNVELDVTEALEDDLQNRDDRSDRSQFRLKTFEDLNLDGNADGVTFSRDQLQLIVKYLVP